MNAAEKEIQDSEEIPIAETRSLFACANEYLKGAADLNFGMDLTPETVARMIFQAYVAGRIDEHSSPLGTRLPLIRRSPEA